MAVGGLAVAAWLALWAWQTSPYGRYLDHDGLFGSDLGAAALVVVFVGGWVLMLTAMMLPSTFTLVSLFAGVVAHRSDRRGLLARLIAGYLAVWVGAGLVAFVADAVLHAVAGTMGWVEAHPWAVAAVVFALAGAYQFASLKLSCLEKCRSPRLLIFTAWRGVRPGAEAFSLGARHGRFCVGCCWALMLIMFALGAGSLLWMLALAVPMAIEKNAPGGAALTAPLGAALLATSAVLVAGGLWFS